MRSAGEKVLRDPVHDVIALRLDEPVDRLALDLLACPEVQRLRRVRQLGLASLAYPGADHSRYSHSLGVFETARKILARLERGGYAVDELQRDATLAAALLHDLGHGPFSHVFERVSGIRHEGVTRRLILDPDGAVYRVLIRHEQTLPERAVSLLEGCGGSLTCDVISSQLDADRLDYLLRDNLMTGSRYGQYDLAWLLQAMTVVESTGGPRLAIGYKGVSAAESFLQARYHMYRHVYFHKVVRAAEGMVTLALRRARELLLGEATGDVTGPNLALPPGSGAVARVLTGDRLATDEFIELDDVSVLGCFKAWRRGGDAMLAKLCAGLLDRTLFKTIDLEQRHVASALQVARNVVTNAGGQPDYDVFSDEPFNRPYKSGGGGILIDTPTGTVDLAEASPFVAALDDESATLKTRRLHVTPEHAEAVRAALKPD